MAKKIEVSSLAPVACIIGAVILAILGKEGWGWLIFAAILLG